MISYENAGKNWAMHCLRRELNFNISVNNPLEVALSVLVFASNVCKQSIYLHSSYCCKLIGV